MNFFQNLEDATDKHIAMLNVGLCPDEKIIEFLQPLIFSTHGTRLIKLLTNIK